MLTSWFIMITKLLSLIQIMKCEISPVVGAEIGGNSEDKKENRDRTRGGYNIHPKKNKVVPALPLENMPMIQENRGTTPLSDPN